MGVPKTIFRESFYLEFGVIEIDLYIKARRLMYYHSLVNRSNNRTLYYFFLCQYSKRSPKDWVNQALEDFSDLDIDSSFAYLENISKNAFKQLVKSRIRHFSFQRLLIRKNTLSKMTYLEYNEYKIQDYLENPDLSIETKKIVFRWRVHMEKGFAENYRNGNMSVRCPLCMSHPDSQKEAYKNCSFIRNKIQIGGSFENIFDEIINSETIRTIVEISKVRIQELNK